MKNFSIIHILLFALMMLAAQCSHAQDYVVLNTGDTLRGVLRPMTFGPEKKLQVVTPDKKKTLLQLYRIRTFSIKDQLFEPVKYEEQYLFMKVLRSGYLTLYGYQLQNQATYDGLFLKRRDAPGIDVPNLGFKKRVVAYLNDCEDVKQKLESGEFAKKDINEIVDAYNACVNSRTTQKIQVVQAEEAQLKKINVWDALESKINEKGEFQGKKDALDMITEIRGKIKRNEKVPNFMIEGLKASLTGAGLQEDLDKALSDLNR